MPCATTVTLSNGVPIERVSKQLVLKLNVVYIIVEDGSFYVKEPIRKALSEKLIGVVQQAFLPILNSRKPLYMIFIKSHTYNLSSHSRRNKIGQHIKNQRVVLFID